MEKGAETTNPEAAPGRMSKPTKRKLAASAGVLTLLAGFTGATLASFTSESRSEVLVSSGSFEVQVNGSGEEAFPLDVDFSLLSPGEERVANIFVENTGELAARVSLTASDLEGYDVCFVRPAADGSWEDADSSYVVSSGDSRKVQVAVSLPADTSVQPADKSLMVEVHSESI